jgi:hypothetical protein
LETITLERIEIVTADATNSSPLRRDRVLALFLAGLNDPLTFHLILQLVELSMVSERGESNVSHLLLELKE